MERNAWNVIDRERKKQQGDSKRKRKAVWELQQRWWIPRKCRYVRQVYGVSSWQIEHIRQLTEKPTSPIKPVFIRSQLEFPLIFDIYFDKIASQEFVLNNALYIYLCQDVDCNHSIHRHRRVFFFVSWPFRSMPFFQFQSMRMVLWIYSRFVANSLL